MKTANEIQAAMVEIVSDYVKGNPMPVLLHRRQYNGGYRSIGVNINGTASITQFTEKWEVDVETPSEFITIDILSIIDLAYLITEINYQKGKS
jgi:adenylyl- and sulfurtransferase ThiI